MNDKAALQNPALCAAYRRAEDTLDKETKTVMTRLKKNIKRKSEFRMLRCKTGF